MADPKNDVTRLLLQKHDIQKAFVDQERVGALGHVFSHKVPIEGDPTNQKSSGRCWQFAALNVLRLKLMKKYNLPKSFQFSQSYLFFFDKIERSNWFLEKILETASEDVGSRIVQHLLSNPTEDGGQWDMMVSLLTKYGVVPQEAFPEVASSSGSHRMNWFIASKLREFAVQLRVAVASGASAEQLQAQRTQMLSCVHRILLANFGAPPQTFDWRYYDKDNKYHVRRGMTPQELLAETEVDVTQLVSVIDDPRNPRVASYTVDKLGNVCGGQPVKYLNVPADRLKELARDSIAGGEAVWFGCDVGKFFDSDSSTLDVAAWRYDLAYGTQFNLNKEQRLLHGASLMTHAMVLTGFDAVAGEEESDKPSGAIKWRIENSWGPDRGAGKGYLTMSDDWFSEYVYQIVVPKSSLTEEEQAAFAKDPIVLPAWDPMGALAQAK